MALPLVYHPDYVAPLPPGHRFPMPKFRLLYESLLANAVARPDQFHAPELPPVSWLEQVHCPNYIQSYSQGTLDFQAQRRIGLPWSEALVRRTWIALGGTILAARLALSHGLACNTAGGTHHAFPNYGSGFCIFNDLAVAARVVQSLNLAQKILIVDLDVHQGDGTAFIFQRDPSVFTFSIHCQVNFPGTKQASDLDVPLAVGTGDQDYLRTLQVYLPDLLGQVRPDLVLYDAGVDPHGDDLLGKLALTDQGLYKRECFVLRTCLAAGYPVASVIGGGYSPDLQALVYRHSLLHRAATQVFQELKL
jgi:acetoin utilization deacetylase AcuC-like enzyme